MAIKAVIFDLDGTLLDTLEDLADSVNAALKQYGCPPRTVEQVRSFVGNGIRRLMIRSVPQGEAHPDFESIYDAFRIHYKTNCRNKTKPYKGVLRLLRTLAGEGKKLAIVSNKADFAVKDLNEYFFGEFHMVAIGECEGIARKPAGNAVYVGDSDVDVKTAFHAGIPCISVLWGFRDRESLLECGAAYLAEDTDGLLALLKSLERV